MVEPGTGRCSREVLCLSCAHVRVRTHTLARTYTCWHSRVYTGTHHGDPDTLTHTHTGTHCGNPAHSHRQPGCCMLAFTVVIHTHTRLLHAGTHRGDPAYLALELGGVAGPAQWALLHRLPSVDGPVRGSTNVKGVVHVIVELAGIRGVLLTC